jgi:transposase InsO family protein
VVDFVRRRSEKTEIGVGRFIHWLGVNASKFYDWRQRYGCVNEHNGWIPRDFWLESWEKEAIIDFHLKNPLEGYRRLTFMLLDADVVAVSPASVWRVLKQAGLLSRWKAKQSRKGTGFEQPLQPHQHWHIDVSYLNVCATFYYLCSVLDGYSRSVVHWDLRESMKEADIELILERAKEKYPEAKPRIISDNGPQFIARDFKKFIRISGMTHVRTSPYYPQSNGKIERTSRQRASAFGREHRSRWTTRFVWWRVTSSITTTFARTVPSAISRRRICWPDASRRFAANATGSWQQLGSNGKSVGSKVPERTSDCSSAKDLLHSAICASLLRASCCSL